MIINAIVLMRVASVAAILGGVLRITSSFVLYQPEVMWLEVMYFIIDYCLLIGLTGVYLSLASQLGVLGLITYFVISVGLSSIVGPDPDYFDVDLYQIGAGLTISGLAVLGLQLLVRGLARIPSGFWIASFMFSVFWILTGEPYLISISGILFGLGFVVSGFTIVLRPSFDLSLPKLQDRETRS